MSFFKNLFNKILPSSTKTNEVVQNSSVTQHSNQNTSVTVVEKKSSGILDVLMSPIRAVTTAVSKVLDIFPDPTKTGTLYDGVNSTYNTVAQTIINVPSTVLGKIPVVSVVGDIASSVLSAGFKVAGIVADHTIMLAANAVEVSKAALVGTVNIVDKNVTGEAHVEFNGKNPETLDSLNEVISHSASYTINNLESHLVHDIDLIATVPDLLVDITRDIENNLNINIPGSDYLNTVIDSTVVNVRDNVVDSIIGNAIKISEGLGLTHTDAGIMRHETMDHVGEGNIREGYEWHGSHGDDHQDADHKQDSDPKQNIGHEQNAGHNHDADPMQNEAQNQHADLKQNTEHSQNNQSVCTCTNTNDHSSSNHGSHDHSHVTQYDLSVSKFLPELSMTAQLY